MTDVFHPLAHLPIELRDIVPTVIFVRGALPAATCEALVARIEAAGPRSAPVNLPTGEAARPDLRDNDRAMFDDPALAAELLIGARAWLPETVDGGRLVGLNERFRGYRYRPGQRFTPHYDGAFRRDAHEASELTVLYYLNDCEAGGETRLLEWQVAVPPRRGDALVFSHRVLHEGAPVEAGVKYVLRTDAMYRR